jgi:hypothetical protein
MLANDPRLIVEADAEGVRVLLTYREEPRSLLYCAISCRMALAAVADSPAPVAVFLSINIPNTGRRFWRLALDASERITLDRETLPASLRRTEEASPVRWMPEAIH